MNLRWNGFLTQTRLNFIKVRYGSSTKKQTNSIKIADSRETLKIWGGQRNILEFRKLNNTKHISNLND